MSFYLLHERGMDFLKTCCPSHALAQNFSLPLFLYFFPLPYYISQVRLDNLHTKQQTAIKADTNFSIKQIVVRYGVISG